MFLIRQALCDGRASLPAIHTADHDMDHGSVLERFFHFQEVELLNRMRVGGHFHPPGQSEAEGQRFGLVTSNFRLAEVLPIAILRLDHIRVDESNRYLGLELLSQQPGNSHDRWSQPGTGPAAADQHQIDRFGCGDCD